MKSIIKEIPIFELSSEKINKTLRSISKLTAEDAQNGVPENFRKFAHLFMDIDGAEDLPPSRRLLDYTINLRQKNGKDLVFSWGALEQMSKEELLDLRKTLTYYLKSMDTAY